MNKCVVIGGASIENYDVIKTFINDDDFIIFCDCGLKHRDLLGVRADLIVGDFDSFENPELDVETIVLPCEKDDTDTVYGVKEGLKRGFDDFLLIGMIGQRFDHSLGNISILLKLYSLGKRALLIDDYSEMEIVGSEPVFIEDKYSFFSLINISGTANEITIENAKYNLTNAEITCDYQYGVSNEVLPGKKAMVKVGKGNLLLIKDR